MNIRTPGHLLEFQNDPTENPARHDNIQFTIEFETNQQIPFLDVSIKRLDNNSFSTSIYQFTARKLSLDFILNGTHSHPESTR